MRLNSKVELKSFESILSGDEQLKSKKLGNQPEPRTEDDQIFSLLELLDLKKDFQSYVGGDPSDFEILNLDIGVIGESKSLNNIDAAEADMDEQSRPPA